MSAAITAAAVVAGGTIYAANKSSGAARDAANAQRAAAGDANATQLQMYNQTREDQTPWRVGGGQAVDALSRFWGLGGVDTANGGTSSTGGPADSGVSQTPTPSPTIDPNQYSGMSRMFARVRAEQQQQGQPAAPTATASTGGTSQPVPQSAQPVDYNKLLSSLPGYQFQLDQGQKAVEHNLAARGLLNSGAAAKALTQYGQGVASNYAQQYVGGLESLAGLGQSSAQATGAAGANAANQIGANQIYAGNAQASGYVGQANAMNAGLSGLAGIAGASVPAYQKWNYNRQYDNLQPFTPTAQYMTPSESPGTTTYFGGP